MPKKNPIEQVEKHDEEARILAENAIIAKAQSLTNGHAGDPKITGEVLLWLTTEMVEQGRLLRTVVLSMQLKEECVLAHSGKMGKVALFGQTYKMPMCLALVLLFLMWYIEFGAK